MIECCEFWNTTCFKQSRFWTLWVRNTFVDALSNMAFTASTFTTFVWHEETLWCSRNSYSRSEKRIHLHLQSQCKEILVSSANFWIPSTSLLWKQRSIICSLFKPLPRVSYGNIIQRWVLAGASMRIFTHVLIWVCISCVILTFWTVQTRHEHGRSFWPPQCVF